MFISIWILFGLCIVSKWKVTLEYILIKYISLYMKLEQTKYFGAKSGAECLNTRLLLAYLAVCGIQRDTKKNHIVNSLRLFFQRKNRKQ